MTLGSRKKYQSDSFYAVQQICSVESEIIIYNILFDLLTTYLFTLQWAWKIVKIESLSPKKHGFKTLAATSGEGAPLF